MEHDDYGLARAQAQYDAQEPLDDAAVIEVVLREWHDSRDGVTALKDSAVAGIEYAIQQLKAVGVDAIDELKSICERHDVDYTTLDDAFLRECQRMRDEPLSFLE